MESKERVSISAFAREVESAQRISTSSTHHASTSDVSPGASTERNPPTHRASVKKLCIASKISSDRVEPTNRLGRRLEAHEVEAAAVAISLQLGLGSSAFEHTNSSSILSVDNIDHRDPPRSVTLPRSVLMHAPTDSGSAPKEVLLPSHAMVELAPRSFARARCGCQSGGA